MCHVAMIGQALSARLPVVAFTWARKGAFPVPAPVCPLMMLYVWSQAAAHAGDAATPEDALAPERAHGCIPAGAAGDPGRVLALL